MFADGELGTFIETTSGVASIKSHVVAVDGYDLFVGTAVEGAIDTVGSSAASAHPQPASAIVSQVAAAFRRGIDGRRVVIGLAVYGCSVV